MDLSNSFEVGSYEVINARDGSIEKLLDTREYFTEELYISNISEGEIRGWKMHTRQEGRLFCIRGKVKFYIKQTASSPIVIVELSEKDNKILILGPGSIYAFQGIKTFNSLLNAASLFHAENESKIFKIDEKELRDLGDN